MKEIFKSYVLVVLVLLSLFQSYYLAFGKPEFTPLQSSEDVQTTWNGATKELAELIEPSHIVLHFGDGRNTILYQDQLPFKETFKKVKQRNFDGFRELQQSTLNWNQLRDNRKGFEVVFPTGIPVTVLADVLRIQGDFRDYFEFIKKIWITTNAKGEVVKAYFITSQNQYVFEATKVDFTVKDIEQVVGWGEKLNQLNNYVWTNNQYYLPEKPIQLVKSIYTYREVSSKQLQTSLFVDPTTSRKLLGQKGIEIYTDGKRGLKIDRDFKWLTYNDPISVPEASTNLESNLQSAVKFINLHGGWDAKFVLSEMPQDINQAYGFMEYVNGYPLFGPNIFLSNSIEVSMKNGLVTNYERSIATINLGTKVKSEVIQLPSLDELLKKNSSYLLSKDIDSITPVQVVTYLPNQQIELMPKWAVKQLNGLWMILQ